MQRERLIAFVSEASCIDVLENIAEKFNLNITVFEGGVLKAREEIENWKFLPEYLVIDTSAEDNGIDILKDTLTNGPDEETNLIVLGRENDVDVYQHVLTLGAASYNYHPVKEEALSIIFGNLVQNNIVTGLRINSEKLISVCSVSGGVGGSTIAANLARGVSLLHKQDTILVDLDLDTSCQQILFDEKDDGIYRDMMTAPERIDSTLLNQAVTKPNKKLSILSSFKNSGRKEISKKSVDILITKIQKYSKDSLIIADIPSRPKIGADLPQSSEIVIAVTNSTFFGLRNTVKFVRDLIDNDNYKGEIIIVINKSGENPALDAGIESFQKEFRQHKIIQIPFEPKKYGPPIIRNSALYEVGGKIQKSFLNLLSTLPTADKKNKENTRNTFSFFK